MATKRTKGKHAGKGPQQPKETKDNKNAGKKDTELLEGEQMQLMDVAPDCAKSIEPLARKYAVWQGKRIHALNQEVRLKAEILAIVHESNIPRMPDGTIQFRVAGLQIKVTPTDEKISVKEAKD